MSGGALVVSGEEVVQHGLEAAWSAEHHTRDWTEYGTAWPCIVAAPHAFISGRPRLYEMIEDDGPARAHETLDALVHHASGFQAARRRGLDIRFGRFQLLIWDYRGRIDSLAITGKKFCRSLPKA